jgi:hypothetical protein
MPTAHSPSGPVVKIEAGQRRAAGEEETALPFEEREKQVSLERVSLSGDDAMAPEALDEEIPEAHCDRHGPYAYATTATAERAYPCRTTGSRN